MKWTLAEVTAHLRINNDVIAERAKQFELRAAGRFKYVPTDEVPALTKERHISWITEELGEASTEVNDIATFLESTAGVTMLSPAERVEHHERLTKLRKELIQVMALTHGWIEKLDKEIANAK